jgi:D-tyrosyl-tRNA(Tyr) deacylase
MRLLIQRVSSAKVTIEGRISGKISEGLLAFLAIGKNDSEEDIKYLVDKMLNLRIFENERKKMDLSLKETKNELLIVSQFTLYGSVKKGRRPDYTTAADPDKARNLYEKFVETCINENIETQTGEFAAKMDVSLVNDGPVTFLIDSASKSANI